MHPGSSVETTSKPRVLAVDDTPANLVTLEAALGHLFELVLVSSGPEALAVLERDPSIDVILMDVMMPGMDGYETAARIKQMPVCKDIPLVFITAVFHEDPHIRRGYAVGGVDYLTKPFDPELLRLKLEVYASFRHRARLLHLREKHLRESEELLRAARRLAAVLDGLPVAVIIIDADGGIRQMNEEVSRILGSGAVLDWWRRNEVTLQLETEAMRPRVVDVECLDGTSRTVLLTTSLLRAIDGAGAGVAVVFQDLTERQQINVDLQEHIARLASIGTEIEREHPAAPT